MSSKPQQAKARSTRRRVLCAHPGSQTQSSLKREQTVTMEIPLRRRRGRSFRRVLKSEEEAVREGKSELCVVAMNAGNAAGAKAER